MTPRPSLWACLLMALSLAALANEPAHDQAPDPVVVIHAGQLLARPGELPLERQSVVIRGRHVDSVHDGFRSPESLGLETAVVIDLSGQFVMPGLHDTHVHLTTEPRPGGVARALQTTDADLAIIAAINARRLLEAGFTTVMDMGNGSRSHEKAIYAVRDAIAAGLIPGPEILAAGSPISATGSSRTSRFNDEVQAVLGPEGVCSGVDSCRDAVREQVARGADFINIYHTGSLLSANSPARTFTSEELHAIIDEAHALNRIAVADGGNTPGDSSGTDEAIRAGVNIIDTVTYPGRVTFDLLKSSGGYFAPHVHALNAAVGDSLEDLASGSMGWLPKPVLLELFMLKNQVPSALAGYQAGATLILAADSGVFEHGRNAHELIDYVALGIDPMTALAAATVNAAAAHRIDGRTGTIEAGKEADLVAFARSLLEDMGSVLEPLFVMTDGRIHSDRR